MKVIYVKADGKTLFERNFNGHYSQGFVPRTGDVIIYRRSPTQGGQTERYYVARVEFDTYDYEDNVQGLVKVHVN